jgi:hypothetical protein
MPVGGDVKSLALIIITVSAVSPTPRRNRFQFLVQGFEISVNRFDVSHPRKGGSWQVVASAHSLHFTSYAPYEFT